MKIPRCLGAAVGCLLLSAPALAELDLSVIAEIRLGKTVPPRPPEVVVVETSKPKGPPPWAPAHGFRRNRGYYYYPGTDVYFRPEDRMWIYLDGRDWRVGATLPAGLRVDFSHSVSLEMETDRPFEFHRQVTEYYPADYFTKKVKIKAGSGKPSANPARADPTETAERSPGKGKGRGKKN